MDLPPRTRPRFAAVMLFALAIMVAAANAWRFLGNVCDDAVISFRSVENHASGFGLVFNPGERVETFTNLGLVGLLAGARAIGIDVFDAATWIGFAAAVGAVAAAWWLARELGSGPGAVWPALFVAASTTLTGQAGSGLETTLCALLTTAGVARVLQECRPRGDGRSRLHGVGVALLALATAVRPDSALVVGGMFVLKAALLARPARRRAFVVDALAIALLVGVQIAFRLSYYGELLPNPVHAKVGPGDPQVLKAGLTYVFEWTRTDFGIAVLLGGLVLAAAANARARALAVLCCGWCLYVVASGGDHMPYSRFFAPMLAVFAATIAAGFREVFAGAGRVRAFAGGVLALAVIVQPVWLSVSRGNVPAKNLANETYRREIGEWFANEAIARGGGLVVAVNPVGYIGCFAGPGVRVIDMLGLCDAHIARRGHRDTRLVAGHQVGDGDYVLAQRPDFVVLGTTTPGDLFQMGDTAALLADLRTKGVDPWQRDHDVQLMVSERELLARDEFFRDYAIVKVPLPSGRPLQVLKRKG